MQKKVKSTYESYLESMNPKQREAYEKELRKQALSELILAAKEQDSVSVRKLAKLAGVLRSIFLRSFKWCRLTHYSLRVSGKCSKRSVSCVSMVDIFLRGCRLPYHFFSSR